jgi:DNA-binding MarR family transcriptional regulator
MRKGPADRASLLRALLLGERYSVGLTRVAVETLSGPRANNRDIELLLAIDSHRDATPGWLSAATKRDPAVISRSLRRFEEDGLTTRRPSPVDGRSSLVRLTRKAKTRIRHFNRSLAQYMFDAAPVVKESLDLLDVAVEPAPEPVNVAEAAAVMARAGQAYAEEATTSLQPYGVTDEHERFTLTLLLDRGQVRPRDLVHEFGLPGNQVTLLLDRMVDAGLITRNHDDPGDRRAVVVHLTARGEEAANVQLDVFARHAKPVAAALALTVHVSRGVS